MLEGQSEGVLQSPEGHRDEQRLKGGGVKDWNPALPREIQCAGTQPGIRATLPHPRSDVRVGNDVMPPAPSSW